MLYALFFLGGVMKNPYSKWIKQNSGPDGPEIAMIRLSPERLAKFNETAAVQWFKTVEGLPYGYHNFIFGWYSYHFSRIMSVIDVANQYPHLLILFV
jgi:hypothetical protein